MIRIAVIGANGQAGRHIVAEALARGFEVTAFVRGSTAPAAQHVVHKDVLAIERSDLAGFDAVVDALGFWTPDTLPLHVKTVLHLADLLSGTKTRLLIVGGAGSLYMDAAHTQQLVDQPFFPAQYRPLASAQRDQLEAIRKRSDVQWTFISPAAEFEVSQPRTGQYVLAGEEFTTNAEGKSVVSYADYAVAVVDLIANGTHIQERVSVRGS